MDDYTNTVSPRINDYFGLINILNTKISLSFQLIGLGKISLLVIYLSWLRSFKILTYCE